MKTSYLPLERRKIFARDQRVRGKGDIFGDSLQRRRHAATTGVQNGQRVSLWSRPGETVVYNNCVSFIRFAG